MCYQPISARIIEAAQKLKEIVKFGVGIDAIDIDAARQQRFPSSTFQNMPRRPLPRAHSR